MSDQTPPDRDPSEVAIEPPAHPFGVETAIRGGAVRVGGYATGVLVSLAAAAILVRHLGIASFGQYVTVTSLIALVGGVTEAGIIVYGIREFLGRGEEARRLLVGNLLAMRLALTLAGIACAVVFGLAAGYSDALVLGTVVAGAGLLAQVVADVLSIPLQAKLLLGRLTSIEVTRRVVALALIAALAALDATLVPFFAASSVAAMVAVAMTAWAVRSFARVRPRFDWQLWRRLFAETLPYAVALSIAAIYLYVTVIVMSLIASSTQTGLFATSFRVTQALLAVPSLLLMAIFPLMSRGRAADAGFGATVGKVFAVAVVFGTWMSLATALGASFIVELIAGTQGAGAAPVLRIQALVFLVSFVSTSSALELVALERYRPLLLVSAATLALNIVLGLALVPSLGAEGGALADVIAEAVAAVGLTTLLARAVPDHEIGGGFLRGLVPATAAGLAVLALPVGSFAHAALATILFFAVMLRSGALPEELTAAARRLPILRALS